MQKPGPTYRTFIDRSTIELASCSLLALFTWLHIVGNAAWSRPSAETMRGRSFTVEIFAEKRPFWPILREYRDSERSVVTVWGLLGCPRGWFRGVRAVLGGV